MAKSGKTMHVTSRAAQEADDRLIREQLSRVGDGDGGPVEGEDGSLVDPIQDAVDLIKSECGTDEAFVTILKFKPDSSGFYRVKKMPLTEFDLDAVAVAYGGGTYKLYFQRSNGQSLGMKKVEFLPSLKPLLTEGSAAPAPVPAPATADVEKIVQAVMAPLQAQIAGMTKAVETAQASKDALMTTVMNALTAALTVSRVAPVAPVDKPTSILDTVELLAKVKTLLGGENSTQMVELLKAGLTLGRGHEDGGPSAATPESKILDRILDTLGPKVGEMVGRLMTGPAPRETAPVEAPPPVTFVTPPVHVTPTPAPPTRPTLPDPQMEAALTQWGPLLEKGAGEGYPPAEAAETILENIPPAWQEPLLTFLRRPDRVSTMTPFLPWVVTQGPWIRDVADALTTALTSEDPGVEERTPDLAVVPSTGTPPAPAAPPGA